MMLRPAVICLISLSLALPVAGQGIGHDFGYFAGINPQLGFSNAASLSSLGKESVSVADLSFSKENGGLISVDGSPDCWKAIAGTESYKRITDRIAFWGKLSYSHFRGQDMGGYVLADPTNSPINFLEEDLTTVGVRKIESYTAAGGMAYSFSDVVSVGVLVDYTSADRVKYKDPRSLNALVDLTVSPGVLFRFSESLSIGFNPIFRHRVEQLTANTYGTKDRTYYMLVDMGGFYGTREQFEGDNGYISLSNTRYLYSDWYGLGIQAITGSRAKVYHELQALWRTGYYGARNSGSVVFCEFSGPTASYDMNLIIPSGSDLQKMSFSASFANVSNKTNSYKATVVPGMNTKITYTGQTKTLSRNDIDANFAYTLYKGTDGYLPQWEFGAKAGAACRLQSTMLYPFRRDWTSVGVDIDLNAGRNIISGRNIYSCCLDAGFFTGFGDPRHDSVADGGSTTMKSFDDYSNREFEYYTAARAGAGVELKYTRRVSDKLAAYVSLSDSFRSLLSKPEYLDGATRNVALLTLGCNF